ncbi:hypothetical protein [Vibrio diazotrophicus]|uniref:Uncharacterized protein n=1 Tax=Vibrio diazotrophicus TaxID=685 RepID=A0ABX4WBU2_VIBDI|nr:hypothetical protein [Vibrio diazotrophicus]PNI00203.1 hypothetical protein C1O25_12580 [Vibrio diazotrophicus]
MKVDSKFESKLANVHGIELTHGQFDQAFYDKDGVPFNALYDAMYTIDGEQYYIEFKQHQLNPKTSIASCHNKLFTQCDWHKLPIENLDYINHNTLSGLLWNKGYFMDSLLHAWNHSAVKHSIIAKEYGNNYIVVFESHPPTVKHQGTPLPFQQYYKQKYGIRTMLLSEFKDKFI